MKANKTVSIKYAFRDEKPNIFMMTEGFELYPAHGQLFVCKNREVPPTIKHEYLLLDSKRRTSYALSSFGKEIASHPLSREGKFVATIESVIKFKVSETIVGKLVNDFFPVWDVVSPLEYFGSNPIGYLWLFRTFESLERTPENLMDIGRSGRNYYYLLMGTDNQPVERSVEISAPVVPNDIYAKKKSELIELLVTNNAFISEIPGVDCVSVSQPQTIPEDENAFMVSVHEALIGKEPKFQHNGVAKEKQKPIIQNGRKKYPRDRRTSLNALAFAGYQCEVNANHKAFLRRMSDIPYTEPHHLIPISYSDDFNFSLDIEENIVSLCSHCHNLLHYGKDAESVLSQLYQQRKELLETCGIEITWDQLREMYK